MSGRFLPSNMSPPFQKHTQNVSTPVQPFLSPFSFLACPSLVTPQPQNVHVHVPPTLESHTLHLTPISLQEAYEITV